MTTPNNGGAAFPVPEIRVDGIGIREGWDGMTLRDYFAAKAMQGFIASLPEGVEPAEVRTGMARDCYEIADAMLAARGAK